MKDKNLMLNEKIDDLNNKTSNLKGKLELCEQIYTDLQDELQNLKESQIINLQAIELLNIISSTNKEIIKSLFENTISHALNYIHQSNDYKFELDFGQRGNLNELKFLLKTPDMQGKHDIMNCRAGGSKDIVALALREVLLEASRVPGFLFLDECEKRLDSPETEAKMIEFIKEIQKETGRQLFVITHSQTMVDSVPNPIIINSSQNSGHSEKMDIKPKRKRGRPKKEK